MATAPRSVHQAVIDADAWDVRDDLRRFTSGEFRRMKEAGILAAAGRYELRDGMIFDRGAEPIDRHRFDVDEYYKLAEVGILHDDERVELIDGEILEMCPIGNRHAFCVDYLAEELISRLRGRAIIRVQGPIRLSKDHEPEPDLSILQPRIDRYREGHPRTEDAIFLIEVMDSSSAKDRKVKLGRYAQAGVPEVWLADLNTEQVESHRRPVNGAYTVIDVRPRGQSLAPEAFPDVVLEIDRIFG